MDGGWQTLTDASGQPFANQGQCIAFVLHHPISLADLANPSITGTTTFFPFGTPCFVTQNFDATYPGSASVGTVTLHIFSGCVNLTFPPQTGTYSGGSFSLTTAVGTVTGSADGPITVNVIGGSVLILTFPITLTVGTASGAFSGMTGTLHFLTTWDATAAPPTFSGSVTVP
jgi:hypothetical protein